MFNPNPKSARAIVERMAIKSLFVEAGAVSPMLSLLLFNAIGILFYNIMTLKSMNPIAPKLQVEILVVKSCAMNYNIKSNDRFIY